MSTYEVPTTAEERINAFFSSIDSFKAEYQELTEKKKKVCGNRARKSLLNISKLTKFIRKDVQDYVASLSTKKDVVETPVVPVEP